MDNSLQSLLQKIKIDAVNASVTYFYYHKDTGKIQKISPKKEETKYAILEVSTSEAKYFLSGEKKTSDYRIVFDVTSKKSILKNILDFKKDRYYSDTLYKIPCNEIVDADLVIEQNTKTKKWLCSISTEISQHVTSGQLNLNEKILLSVTKKDDPNILYRSLYFDLSALLKNSVEIPFKYHFESANLDVSIYTYKYFETYSHKVIK